MLPQRIWFLRRFALKTGIDFAHFGLEFREESTGVFERIYDVKFQINKKKEREMTIQSEF